MKPFLPMTLQFFAAEDQTEIETEETQVDETTAEEEATEKDLDSEKVVEKLQKRLASKTFEEKETKTQLEQALSRIEELENAGKKGVKELSDEEKEKNAQQEKDKTIQDLQDKLKLAEAKTETDAVFKEAGLSVTSDVLDMVVSVDDTETFSNAKALIQFANSVQEATRKEFLKGTTPKVSGQTTKTYTQSEFDAMTYSERAKLATDSPDQFRKLTGGI
ncbi:capsid assembly scaffolding protein Gp46 family protein [Enterococcus avium]|uniref:capsid assembly scaffolding protein Gp46 family protein n=1 Tax=Enterococcus avium TaxID=33945 RepID=UPI0032E3C32E